MPDLAEFLLARIAEDEEAAKEAQSRSAYGWADSAFEEAVELAQGEGARDPALGHIARWDPARVLAECAAKRRIVEQSQILSRHGTGRVTAPDMRWVLTALAAVYAEHEDYDPEWRP